MSMETMYLNSHNKTPIQSAIRCWWLTCCLYELTVHCKGQERLSQILIEVTLHCTGDGLSVPFKLICEVNLIQFSLFHAIFEEFGRLGDNTWLTVEALFIQTLLNKNCVYDKRETMHWGLTSVFKHTNTLVDEVVSLHIWIHSSHYRERKGRRGRDGLVA